MTAIAVFVGIAYGLSIALSLVVATTGGYQSSLAGLAFVTMFIPAAAAVATGAVTRERLGITWNRFPVRYLPVALFLMPVVLHAVMLPMLASQEGALPWQDWLTPSIDGLYHAPAARGWGALTLRGLVSRIALNAV